MAIISQVIVYIMVVFMAIAAIDRMFGSKLGLGDEFEGGFNAMGGLALGMGGIMVKSVNAPDYTVTLAVLIFYSLVSLITVLIVDLSYGIVDPRVRMGGKK